MKKVNHTFLLSRKDGIINTEMASKDIFYKKVNHTFAIQKDFVKRLKIEVSEDKEYKSNPQLGYLHSEVLYKCVISYNMLGWKVTTQEQAKALLKEHTHYYEEITNEETGECFKILKSFSKASKEQMMMIIDFAIIEICGTAGVDVVSPDEYYSLKK